jgi:hypothetical protein
MEKFEVVNVLSRHFGYTSYLEICVPHTGHKFSLIDRKQLSTADRLMYRCPDPFDDGEPITFRTRSESSYEIIRTLRTARASYDIIFVDPFHTFGTSIVDIAGAFSLLNEGGTIVVHDCNPPTADVATPEYVDGPWCGVTFAAFIDFALGGSGSYLTVDADYGCGVISKKIDDALLRSIPPRADLTADWLYHRHASDGLFAFFDRNRAELLRLVSSADFQNSYGNSEAILAHEESSA